MTPFFVLHVVSADVLRDPARLAARDARAADMIEQRRLAVVDVTHHGDDRRARLGFGVRRFRFGEQAHPGSSSFAACALCPISSARMIAVS
jgi:hypothetical protein